MKKRALFRFLLLLALIVLMIVSLVFISNERKKLVCKGFTVVYNTEEKYVSEAEVGRVVKRILPNLNGTRLDAVKTHMLELELEKNPWVENAEIFKGYQYGDSLFYHGQLKIHLEQRIPFFRVMDGNYSYYIDSKGKRMPQSLSGTAYVPVVTGHVTAETIDSTFMSFVSFIHDNSFWKAQIQQIHVRNDGELLLIPRVGSHKIVFGDARDIEKKFRNLKAVYEKGFSHGGWNDYKYVSLKYNNLVVCTRK
jgi:cell division protein FtsQ